MMTITSPDGFVLASGQTEYRTELWSDGEWVIDVSGCQAPADFSLETTIT